MEVIADLVVLFHGFIEVSCGRCVSFQIRFGLGLGFCYIRYGKGLPRVSWQSWVSCWIRVIGISLVRPWRKGEEIQQET